MREDGFYWVREKIQGYPDQSWQVCRWLNHEMGGWWSQVGDECTYRDEDMDVIGPRIEPPSA